jgi:glycerol-3-phosphate dehydrogenase (NAD(P)+)
MHDGLDTNLDLNFVDARKVVPENLLSTEGESLLEVSFPSFQASLTSVPDSNENQLVPEQVSATLVETQQAINRPQTANWLNRPVVIGSGAYGTAIGHRLSESGRDVTMLARDEGVVRGINEEHRNDKSLLGKELSPTLTATTSDRIAFLDRGVAILAVPSIAIESVLNGRVLHEDSIVVSMAKGLITKGWDTSDPSQSLKYGPPRDIEIFTPLQFLRQHESTKHVKNFAVASGPGFASNIIDRSLLHLTVAANNIETLENVSELFSDRSKNTFVFGSHDTIGVEIASVMKNVIAIVVGVCHGLQQKEGTDLYPTGIIELIKCLGMNEAAELADRLARVEENTVVKLGRHGSFLGPAGYADLNLTTSSVQGRNFSLGIRLAEGIDIETIVKSQAKVYEGAWSAWAVKRLADDLPHGVYMPVTNALIDIFKGADPSVRIEKLLTDTSKMNQTRKLGWVSGEGISPV